MSGKRIGTALCFVAAMVFFGFLLGGFLGGRVFGGTGMGWDRLADALGGMALGVASGLALAIALVGRLHDRQRLVAAAGLLVGAALVMLLFRIVPQKPMTDLGTPCSGAPPAWASTAPSSSSGTLGLSPWLRRKCG